MSSSWTHGGGYTCGMCGAYVPTGTPHWHPASMPPTQSVKWDRMSDVRIADALERIAAALEKQAATNPGEDTKATKGKAT